MPPGHQWEKRVSEQQPRKPTFWQIVKSILGGALGVQSEETRQRDFTQGNPAVYIIGGIVFTLLFIVILVVIVNLVLSSAT